MSKASSVQHENVSQTVSRLASIGDLDTLYRDLYMQRAHELMETILSYTSYTNIRNGMASVGLVEQQLRAAIKRSDWERAAELTERVRTIHADAERKDVLDLAGSVYDKLAEIPIDPFSPGFHALLDRTGDQLNELRNQAIKSLSILENTDASKKDFYARRRADFEALKVNVQVEQKDETASPVNLRQEALSALDSGDIAQLGDLVAKLSQKPEAEEKKEKKENGKTAAVEFGQEAELGANLDYWFSDATVEAASRLGFTPARTKSRRQFASLMSYKWQPSFLDTESKRWAREQFAHLSHSAASGDKMQDAVEFYLFNPFINSGGARYQVNLVEEDLLIEDFDEPDRKTDLPRTQLLSELGLGSRWALSRIEIENALLTNGPRILKDILGLEPEAFRLVAIPPDVYSILGGDRGWGQKEMWTHFDGYWVQPGRNLQALAGGDTRFGGTHDVISFPPGYTKDTLLARFAVVQRKRMMTWQRA